MVLCVWSAHTDSIGAGEKEREKGSVFDDMGYCGLSVEGEGEDGGGGLMEDGYVCVFLPFLIALAHSDVRVCG